MISNALNPSPTPAIARSGRDRSAIPHPTATPSTRTSSATRPGPSNANPVTRPGRTASTHPLISANRPPPAIVRRIPPAPVERDESGQGTGNFGCRQLYRHDTGDG